MPFLGHYVLREGVELDPIKTATAQDWPTPRTVKDVRAFLGFAAYCRRYIPNFASVVTPLMGLTKKDAKPIWDDDGVSPLILLPLFQVTSPSWIQWWVGPCTRLRCSTPLQ